MGEMTACHGRERDARTALRGHREQEADGLWEQWGRLPALRWCWSGWLSGASKEAYKLTAAASGVSSKVIVRKSRRVGTQRVGPWPLEQPVGARQPWPHTHHHPRSIREPSWAEGLRKFSDSMKGRDSTLFFCDVDTGLGRGLINIGALS